jgi:hypothetical protein
MYSGGSSISSINIPPGLFGPNSAGMLQNGGVYTTNQSTDLVFLNQPNLIMRNTMNAFAIGVFISGFNTSGSWQPVQGVNFGGDTGVKYTVSYDYSISLYLPLSAINAGNLTPATVGAGAGYVVAVTIFYL